MRAKYLPQEVTPFYESVLTVVCSVAFWLLPGPLAVILTEKSDETPGFKRIKAKRKEGLLMLLDMVSDRVRQKALELHNGNVDAAEAWLGKKNPLLGNNSPFEVSKIREGEMTSGEGFLYNMMESYARAEQDSHRNVG